MAYFFCDKCSTLVPLADRAAHRASHDTRPTWSKNRDRAAQAAFRRAVMTAQGSVCAVCGTPDGVQAHHRDGDVTNNDPSNGIMLCREHHKAVDCHAR